MLGGEGRVLTLFNLLFALRFGAVPAFGPAAAISLRAESREVAAETRRGGPRGGSEWGTAPASPQWLSQPQPGGPAAAPVFAPYRPEEWVARVADRLHVKELGVTHAAMWFLASPIRLDVASDHVYVSYTVHGP